MHQRRRALLLAPLLTLGALLLPRSSVAEQLPDLPGVTLAPQETPAAIIGLDEIRRGQTGYGLSVFAGLEAERFEVEVLGVLRDFSPQSSAIIARLTGKGLEDSGVIGGMSGSPVYIDGRLAGAVAFSWNYAKEAIAGITPISAMRRLALGGTVPGRVSSSAWATPPVSLQELVRGELPKDLLVRELRRFAPALADQASSGLVWNAGGFGRMTRGLLGDALGTVSSAGTLRPVDATLNVGATPGGALSPLQPGSPVAGVLIRGDLQLAATGTVTDRFGDEVLAFGHPFLGFGPVALPMAAAEVVTVISSTANSFKLANLGPVVGAFQEDRQAGVYGRVGASAPVVPFHLRVSGVGIPEPRTFSMEIAALKPLLPTLFAVATIGSLESAGHGSGSQALDLKATIHIEDHGTLELEQSFDGEGAGVQSAIYLLSFTANALMTDLEDVRVTAVDVELERSADQRSTRILGAHADKGVVRPGETVRLLVDLMDHGGHRDRAEIAVQVPDDIPEGRFFLLVADGATADATRVVLEPAVPATFPQLKRFLGSLHSRRDLVVLGLVSESGLAVAGEVLPRLPGSVRSLWQGAAPGSSQNLSLAVVAEQVERRPIPFDGLARVDIEVRRP